MLLPEDFDAINTLISTQVEKAISDKLNYEKYLINTEESKVTIVNDTEVSNYFVDSINSSMSCWDILNWYRNLYYKDGKNTEHGIMAWTIDECFKQLKKIGFFDGN